jgi:hypothetical protein
MLLYCHKAAVPKAQILNLTKAGVTVIFLRSHVTRWDIALGHLLVVPLGNDSLGVWISKTNRGWRLRSHQGQWRFYNPSLPRGGIMTLGYHYGLPGTNAGEHLHGVTMVI